MSSVKTFSLVEVNTENTSKIINLIANGGNGNYIFSIVEIPTYGSLSEIKGNKVIYTPNKNYVGYDSFIYNCTDTLTTSAPSTVIINMYAEVLKNVIINTNIFETPVITLEPIGTYTILDTSIGIIQQNKIILKKTGQTQVINTLNNQKILLNIYYYNKNNINNIISPTLSYQRNIHSFYKNQIKKTNKIIHTKFQNYTPLYFQTSYDRILNPSFIIMPY